MTTPYPTEPVPARDTTGEGTSAGAGGEAASDLTADSPEPGPAQSPGHPGAEGETTERIGTPGSVPGGPGSTEPHGVESTERLDTSPTTHTPLTQPAPAPTPTPTETVAPRRRGARMGTVVWGILLAAIGAGIVARGLGVRFDVELALIVVLCVMGGALLVGSIVAGIRKT